ncbi:zinc-dependent alcohol dehydrogenase [Microvirga arabica]|uniref:zinc-dependent alcohol dehydrogenase n=1 Tax=Microvirga arabica TaxID=1128671 RepID=UPI001939B2AB|nr:alcohol dehydrogenase catalytic domain-containing protein [Microvirga arabica]MBM1173561.1 alcohol dehydrogenase catalytic domain-containing protein [Microvirga arabica]
MKALVYTGPNSIELRDEPDPAPQAGEVLVRVEAVGICGSDMHAYHGYDSRRPAPLILGHEAAGEILSGRKAGMRVTINPLVTCGHCEFCESGVENLCLSRQILSMPPRAGAFAEIVRVPERNLVEVPPNLEITKAALAEPIAVSYHSVIKGARLLPRPLSASRCAVLGGGAIGLTAALVLAMNGAAEIFVGEPSAARRQTVARAGNFQCYAPGETGEPDESSVDLVIDAVGAAATRVAASRMIKPGGVTVHVGLLPGLDGFDLRKITLQEIIVTGSYCYTMADFRETVSALAGGRLGALDWFEERPLAGGSSAFADLDRGAVSQAKIVLRP